MSTEDDAGQRKIFISYRRADSAWPSSLLRRYLELHFGRNAVFQDVVGIPEGANFPDVLHDELRSSAVVLAVLGPDWLRVADKDGRRRIDDEKDWVGTELRLAHRMQLPVIPILLGDVKMPSATAFPAELAYLATRKAVTLKIDSQERDIEHIINAIEKHANVQPRARSGFQAAARQIRATTERLLGRTADLGRLHSFLSTADQYRWIVGDAWAGKTALLAEFVGTLDSSDVDVVGDFLSRSAANATGIRFLSRVINQLETLLAGRLPSEPSTPDFYVREQFYELWTKAEQRAKRLNRRLVLVVDGLDEDLRLDYQPSIASLLPLLETEYSRLLVSSRPGDVELIRAELGSHPMATLTPHTISVSTVGRDNQRLAEIELASLQRNDLGSAVVGALSAAAGPLTIDDIARLTRRTTGDVESFIAGAARRSLRSIGEPPNRRYCFANATLLDGTIPLAGSTARLDGWANEWRQKGWPRRDEFGRDVPIYFFDSYPSRVAETPAIHANLVTDSEWVTAAVEALGIDEVISEVRSAAVASPDDDRLATLLVCLRHQASTLDGLASGAVRDDIRQQVAIQAMNFGESRLARQFLDKVEDTTRLFPLVTTIRECRSLICEVECSWVVHGLTFLSAVSRAEREVEGFARPRRDRGLVVGVCDDGIVRTWNPTVGSAPPVSMGTSRWATGVLARSNDRSVICSGRDTLLYDWDIDEPGVPKSSSEVGGPVASLVVSASGKAAAILTDGTIRVRDDEGSIWRLIGRHPSGVQVALGEDYVLTAGRDGQVLRWSAYGNEPHVLKASVRRRITALLMLANSEDFVTGDERGRILLWTLDEERHRSTLLGSHSARVTQLVQAGQRILSGSIDGRVRAWQLQNPGTPPIELGAHSGAVHTMAVGPDGSLATTGEDRCLKIWDPQASNDSRPIESAPSFSVTTICQTEDNRLLIGGDLGSLWVTPSGRLEPALMTRVSIGDIRARRVAHVSDGSALIVDSRHRCWVVEISGARAPMLLADRARLVVSGGHSRAVVVTAEDDLAVYDGTDLRHLGRAGTAVVAAACTRDEGNLVIACADGSVQRWNLASGERLNGSVSDSDKVSVIRVMPDARIFLADATGRFWIAEELSALGERELIGRHVDGWFTDVAISPDGKLFFVSDARLGVHVWDVDSRAVVQEIRCRAQAVGVIVDSMSAQPLLTIGHSGFGMSTWGALPPKR